MTALWIVLGLVVLLAVFVAVSYNRFVSQRNLVQESWRQIDVELKRRHDLIPNLVETVKGYATHEREVFDAVTRARAAASAPKVQYRRLASLSIVVARLQHSAAASISCGFGVRLST